MFGDVTGPRPFVEARDEPTPSAQRTGVILQGRQQCDEGLREVREEVGWELLQDAQVDEQPNDRFARPVVRTAQDAGLQDAQGGARARRVG